MISRSFLKKSLFALAIAHSSTLCHGNDMRFDSRVIHKGQAPDKSTGAIIPPIFMTSTFVQESPGVTKGYDYTRAGNPNFICLEEQLASLESASHATVFSSGLGAMSALLSTLHTGDRVVAFDGLYGGTYRLLKKVLEPKGIHFSIVPSGNEEELLAALDQGAKFLIFETPTNPRLDLIDIEHFAKVAHSKGALCVVDNTFASPYFQSPLSFGADIVLHSTTKYLGGHSDVVGGVLITNDAEIKKQMDFQRMACGYNPSPFDCWLTSRGVKTLALRMAKHAENAQKVAEYLQRHPLVERVYYPGLPSDPHYHLKEKQMRGAGGIVSVELRLSLEESKKFISSLRFFSLAESLGGVESLVDHPASMTHASIPSEERRKMGLNDGLLRLSVGIEDSQDLLEDLEEGLSRFL